MKKQSRGEPTRNEVAPVNHLVERVQFACVVKTGKDEGGETEHVKVAGLVRASAAEVDEEADGEVGHADQILPGDGESTNRFTDDHRSGDIDATAPHQIGRFRPGAYISQALWNIARVVDRRRLNRDQYVIRSDARAIRRTVGEDAQSANLLLPL